MKIYNQEKTQILENPDLTLGYLVDDVLVTHHDEVPEVLEQGHFEVEKEYPNGGKDLKWVVDVESVSHQDAYDEEEAISVYIPYTKEELKGFKYDELLAQRQAEEDEKLGEVRAIINGQKEFLANTDYKVLKHLEGCSDISEEDYIDILAMRAAARAEINKAEVLRDKITTEIASKYKALFVKFEIEPAEDPEIGD